MVFLVLDGLPVHHVGERLTPRLAALAATGIAVAGGARGELPATTYPNHRTFATGRSAAEHGVRINADRGSPGTDPTIFDVCRRHAIPVEAVLGDHKLVGVMGAAAADRHWPPDGHLPADTEVDEYGYATDGATLGALLPAIERAPELLVAHLNDPDTAGHLLGCETPAAHARYRATDAVLGQVLDALRPRWDDLIVIVVSDHGQEMLTGPPTDLAAQALAAGVAADVRDDGSAALVLGDAEVGAWLAARAADPADDGVEGLTAVPGGWVVWPAAGGWYGPEEFAGFMEGMHGSPRTQPQVAVVAGGHPQARRLVAALRDGPRPDARDWAPTLAALLGVEMPTATGRSLLG